MISLDQLIDERRVVVCVGSGGVGKTTTSAVIALHAALRGRRVLVLTIDPAKRLANSLGVSALDDSARAIPLERFTEIGLEPKGSLDAMMLDMKHAFDRLIDRHAPDAATRQRILDNRFYRYFSTSLAGTQEYSAMERLHELYLETDYELIVLDTPPTTHALDFLDAPNRLFEALDSKAFQWLAKPSLAAGKLGLGLFSLGTSSVIKVLSRFTGSSFLEELSDFIGSFGDMWEGFKERAARTREILGGPDVAFFIITSPDALTLQEALFFHDRLREERLGVGGFVVNRVHQAFVPQPVLKAPVEEVASRLDALETLDAASLADADRWLVFCEHLQQNARDFHVLAHQDEEMLERLRAQAHRDTPVLTVPFFSTDIYSFKGLDRIRRELFEPDTERSAADRTLGRL